MFGTLKPRMGALPQNARQDYRLLYCGVCAGLGEHLNHASRATLSHDTVLLATLAEALTPTPSVPSKTRCPMMPLHHRPTLDAQAFPIRYASAVHGYLIDQWFADKVVDGNRVARIARRQWSENAQKATTLLADEGFSLKPFRELETRQSAVERRRAPTIKQASEATEDLLGHLFAHLATVLPQPETHRATLHALGQTIGRIIYLADALQDLTRDLKRGHFNPCTVVVQRKRVLDPSRVDACVKLLNQSVEAIEAHLSRLPLRRNEMVLRHILLVQWPQRIQKLVAKTYVLIDHDPKQRTLPERWLAFRVMMITMFWQMVAAHQQFWAFQRESIRRALGRPPQSCPPQVAYAVAYENPKMRGSISPMSMHENEDVERQDRRKDDMAEEIIESGLDCCDCCECSCDALECCSDCDCNCADCGSCDGCDACCCPCDGC